MTLTDAKLALLNGFTLFFSFTDIELFLKIVLLAVSIIYTIIKTIQLLQKHNNQKES